MEMFIIIQLSLAALAVLSASYYWFRSRTNQQMCNDAKLPPGSNGLPFVGETFQFFVPYTSTDISPFVKKRVLRYGPVFRTNLIGHPVVVSTDPEINAFVFKKDEELFKSYYTDSFANIMGNDGLMSLEGSVHKYVRNLTLHEFGPHNLKSFLPELEQCTIQNLKAWSTQPSVNLKEAVSTMIHRFAVERMFSLSDPKIVKEFKQSFDNFLYGLISFPINIPGTAYWKCMQGRKTAIKIIKMLLEERLQQQQQQVKREQRDYLDFVISEMHKDASPLTKKRAVDLLFILTFASFESTSSAIVSVFHYLSQHPAALEQLTREQEAVVKTKNEDDKSGVSWEDYKSMNFTHMVINETIRLTNIVPGIFRKALKDIEIKGYRIPAGWTVMVYPTAVHLNPEVYEDPLTFNPWRWEGQKLHAGSQNFMAFGGGARLCSGADYVKVHMAILLHHIVTNFRWNVIHGTEPVRYPGVMFPDGFHVRLQAKNGHQK